MNRNEFKAYLNQKIMVLDGATGTELQKRGMPTGVCPERWVIDHPQELIGIQTEYITAGSDVVYTFTFGCNRIKLAEYGYASDVIPFNRQLAQISRQAAGEKWVAGDISSTGRFVRPFGDLPFEEAVNIFKEQVAGLLEGGVDFFVIETMFDIQEARAALLAVKESCDLPVCVSMTFDEDQRTITGTDPLSALITLQSLGADAVGCNCSTGPDAMVEIIKQIKPYANVPILAKPNAGLPHLVDGMMIFDMEPETFGSYGKPLIEAGVNLIGGCCGTAPSYIKNLTVAIDGCQPIPAQSSGKSGLSSARKTVFVGAEYPMTVVGERINPTGKKVLQAELREGKLGEVRRLAMEQVDNGAALLDINVGMSGINELETMVRVVETLSTQMDVPLCLDSANPEVIEAALRIYPGKALVNSISGEKAKMEKLIPIVAKYGAMFVLLPLDDEGIPGTADARIKIAERVISQAEHYGLTRSNVVVDGLVMTVSAEQKAAVETLNVIEWAARNGLNSIIGLSNVSFGLPERAWINGAFLAMAAVKGLTLAIANPSLEVTVNLKLAADVLTAKDHNGTCYIRHFSKESPHSKDNIPIQVDLLEQIRLAVIHGEAENIASLLKKAEDQGNSPQSLMNEQLIPAINQVGDMFEKKQYFLPQLIQSAETMKAAFSYLEPHLNESGNVSKNGIKIILATVKGDIHDIGKNIVGLMLRNYGFQVYDLGKDVPANSIISKVKELHAKIVGLSALMTTTMVEMKTVIALAKQEGLTCKFMIGGAAVDEAYAREIGADGYASDALQAVKLARQLSEKAEN